MSEMYRARINERMEKIESSQSCTNHTVIAHIKLAKFVFSRQFSTPSVPVIHALIISIAS